MNAEVQKGKAGFLSDICQSVIRQHIRNIMGGQFLLSFENEIIVLNCPLLPPIMH